MRPPLLRAIMCGTAYLTASQTALQVDIEHDVPPLLGDVPGQRHVGDAGVADEDVDLVERLDGRRHRAAPCRRRCARRPRWRAPGGPAPRPAGRFRSESSAGCRGRSAGRAGSRQISSAAISAPSAAMVTACARPWPRAAPVIRATLPSSLPIGGDPYERGRRSPTGAHGDGAALVDPAHAVDADLFDQHVFDDRRACRPAPPAKMMPKTASAAASASVESRTVLSSSSLRMFKRLPLARIEFY